MAEDNPLEARSPGPAGRPDETDGSERPAKGRPAISPAAAAQRATAEIAALTQRRPESVISIERADDRWRLEVEVVETHRIPDAADILAVYEVELLPSGALHSYRRVRRYVRGQLNQERRREYR